jgi:arylformamidase
VNVSKWTLSPHVGTHADAPLHVSTDAPGADQLPHAAFHGDAFVVDVSDVTEPLSFGALESRGVPRGVERLLLRTGRSTAAGVFPAEWPALAADAAGQLVTRGLRLLGVDAPSVDERESTSLEVHHAVFGGGAYVLENLDLREIVTGRYELFALPILTGAVDAAPARALLRPLA